MDSFDWFEFLMPIVLLISIFVFIYVYGVIPERNEQKIREMIIKDSSEYTTFKECIEIESLYYCK